MLQFEDISVTKFTMTFLLRSLNRGPFRCALDNAFSVIHLNSSMLQVEDGNISFLLQS